LPLVVEFQIRSLKFQFWLTHDSFFGGFAPACLLQYPSSLPDYGLIYSPKWEHAR
jgi:hypothetical protein